MSKSASEEIQKFLDGVALAQGEKYQSLLRLRKIIFDVYPEANEKMKYGGIVFFLDKVMFGGLFVYQNHISLEFSNGFLMKDPKGLLQGKGKYRRHLKFVNKEDLNDKEVARFVKQAL